ncbi:hypothetical protein H8D36_06225 [archaeon]|nr:hypothetical protein [archaeon]MBL7056645.1 hypothetical protein [Candidatus Woesearchaeota archaeon]
MTDTTLTQWTISFVKHKDIFTKSLQGYEEKDDLIIFHFKDKDNYYIVKNILDDSVLSFIKNYDYKSVVCGAKMDNLKFLIDNWDVLSKSVGLNFIFVQIDTNARWMINPNVHSKICDEESLELGLKSMFSGAFQP